MKAVSIIIVGSSAIASSTSSDVNINVNNKSNPHHYKKRYDNGRRGLSSAKAGKNGKGSKGSNSKGTKASVVMPTPAPDLDDENDLDNENETTNPTSVPTSNPTSAPSSNPTVPCELTCADDSFTIVTDSTSDTPYYFGLGAMLPDNGIYSDSFLENDVVCGDDTLVLRSISGGDGFTFTTDSEYPNTILMLSPPCAGEVSVVYEACASVDGEDTEDCCTATMTVDVKPCAAFAPCQDQEEGDTCEFDGQVCTCGANGSYGEICIPAECAGGCTEGCSCPFEDATCNEGQGCFCNGDLVWVGTCPGPVGIEKGKSEGIGFDPRAFKLDEEEEDLNFLMSSMSMSM